MSRAWDNVIWKHSDGTWGYGFFEVLSHSEDGDREEYDYDKFAFAGTGFMNEDSVHHHIRRNFVNPGSHTVYEKSNEETEEFQDMARATNDPRYAREREERIKKKEIRELRKRIRKNLREMEFTAGLTYRVEFTAKGPVTSPFDLFVGYTGRLEKDGDWFVMPAVVQKNGKRVLVRKRVWNEKTRLPAPNVYRVTSNRTIGW